MNNEKAKIKFEVIKGVEGASLYINDYRVSGPKPWGGGTITNEFRVDREEINKALRLLAEPEKPIRDTDKSPVTCPKCKRVDGLMWDARPKIWRCVWKDCEYIEKLEKICKTCGGRKKVTEQGWFFGHQFLVDCPDCPDYPQEEPKPRNDILVMPKLWIGQIYNVCTNPCDMLCGPCICGAWHHLEEWVITRKKLTKDGWVNPTAPKIETNADKS